MISKNIRTGQQLWTSSVTSLTLWRLNINMNTNTTWLRQNCRGVHISEARVMECVGNICISEMDNFRLCGLGHSSNNAISPHYSQDFMDNRQNVFRAPPRGRETTLQISRLDSSRGDVCLGWPCSKMATFWTDFKFNHKSAFSTKKYMRHRFSHFKGLHTPPPHTPNSGETPSILLSQCPKSSPKRIPVLPTAQLQNHIFNQKRRSPPSKSHFFQYYQSKITAPPTKSDILTHFQP